ncbi:MAG TPA: response regulator transcription factor [Rhodopila sp.]|uniref:response regulator transcription factor n=1 Tax=Rhodopila sp. TaxID=2480087 RepID=UPI002C358568|nr:response regulator transcription factor [Rhodopila sp.]HVY15969.1 response regulator transcription factor [Rhodopila sp.]
MRILLVERTRNSVSSYLDHQHFVLLCAEDADEAMSLLRYDSFDIVVLNMGFRIYDTFGLIRRMRAAKDNTPILALTGAKPHDRVKALTLGADDAASLPLEYCELHARLASIVRRNRGFSQSMLEVGNLRLCLATRRTHFGKAEIHLTGREMDILEVLMLRRDSIVTKSTLLDQLYGGIDQPNAKILDVLVCRLRKKLEQAGAEHLIRTVWGHGYTVVSPSPECTAGGDQLAA